MKKFILIFFSTFLVLGLVFVSVLLLRSSNNIQIKEDILTSEDSVNTSKEYYVGKLHCVITSTKDGLDVCLKTITLENNMNYEIIMSSSLDLDVLNDNDSVRVLGILNEGVSPLGLDGIIEIFEISKI